ncbi:MAG: hypothetical protein IIC71_03205 [Acidobacteria bacterium]|nr:hypothetical protein [Acidobacteriota bacterium]
MSGSAMVAEDLAQEAFLRPHADWSSVEDLANPSACVRRVAVNLAMSRFRRLRSETAALLRLVPAPTLIETAGTDHEAFWGEVRKLPRRQAQAIPPADESSAPGRRDWRISR